MVLVTPAPRAAYPVARPGTGARPTLPIKTTLPSTSPASVSSRGAFCSRAQASGCSSMRHGQPRDDVDLRLNSGGARASAIPARLCAAVFLPQRILGE
ncbi:hypothetical protein E2C01_045587 [Portunus trituberculatus]|uniref:Uncharacterized protein n=1 Tax=Portunus trituberculatus TaxID=210409 RepID=A0A5B7G2V7_PORTR|nr:hypothetical protein [Portunus trituberculatus]